MTAVAEGRLTGRASQLTPGDGLLHVLPLAAIALLLVNDHLLKAAWPGIVTGKLSDFCGLAYFPLFLVAVWELATQRFAPLGSRRVLILATLATGAAFAAVKTVPIAAATYSVGLGWLQWLAGGAQGTPQLVAIAMDATDLVALPALLVAYWVGSRRVTG
jgi:hypothetical protein